MKKPIVLFGRALSNTLKENEELQKKNAAQRQSLNKKNEVINRKNEAISKKNETINNRNEVINKKNKAIRKQKETIARQQETIENQEAIVVFEQEMLADEISATEFTDTTLGAQRRYESLYWRLKQQNKGLLRQLHDSASHEKWKAYLGRVFIFRDWVTHALNASNDLAVDVCVVHASPALEAGRAVKDITNAKLVFDGVEHPEYIGRAVNAEKVFTETTVATDIIEFQEQMILKSTDCILVGSRGVAEMYWKYPELPRAAIVRNCLDFQELAVDVRIRDDCGLKPEENLLLYPNTVFPNSGIDTILEALALLPDNIHLAIMGRITRTVEPLVKKYQQKLQGRLHILPLRGPKDLIEYRSGADFSIIPLEPDVPNHKTCLPNRIFESIMSRLPLIVSNLPHVRELIEEFDCGTAFEEQTPEAAAEAIRCAYARRDHYKAQIDACARAMCWEREREVYHQALAPVLEGRQGLNILFLANKSVSTNRRVFRHSRELADAAHKVTVMAFDTPNEALRDPRIKYMKLDDEWRAKRPSSFRNLELMR